MIREAYVTFETAKLLKEKEFDWECIGYYVDYEPNDVKYSFLGETNSTWESRCCSAPTLQMAMKWLREVHNLHISVNMGFDVDYSQYFFYVPFVCRFSNKGGEYLTPFDEKEFGTYEKACEAAIKYCLENLI